MRVSPPGHVVGFFGQAVGLVPTSNARKTRLSVNCSHPTPPSYAKERLFKKDRRSPAAEDDNLAGRRDYGRMTGYQQDRKAARRAAHPTHPLLTSSLAASQRRPKCSATGIVNSSIPKTCSLWTCSVTASLACALRSSARGCSGSGFRGRRTGRSRVPAR
jgi:hypothetical protein